MEMLKFNISIFDICFYEITQFSRGTGTLGLVEGGAIGSAGAT